MHEFSAETASGEAVASKPVAPFPATYRLLKPAEYQAVFKRRQSAHNACFGIYVRYNSLGHARLGLVVSKKVSKKAVIRNRIKRQVRESFRHQIERSGQIGASPIDFVVVAKAPLGELGKAEIRSQVEQLWRPAKKRCKR